MIITRTPFRIGFSGGGSDLPEYYRREAGVVFSTAIDRYMYLTLNDHFGGGYRVSYSRTELTERIDQIQHSTVHECLKHSGIRRGLEIVSVADLPAQSGMGSSSSFTVGLLHALYATEGRAISAPQLAEEACRIEIELLKEPIGKQDQYIAAHGGMQLMRFNPDGAVVVEPVGCRPETRRKLNDRLVLLFTGILRDARDVLSKQKTLIEQSIPALRKLTQIACELRDVLRCGKDLNGFGSLLHEAWESKRSIESSISNSKIDEYYDRGRKAGALGGKLLGAGGGGFLLFYCEPRNRGRLRAELSELTELPFSLEQQGSRIIYAGGNR